MTVLRRLLAHPRTRHLDIDNPSVTELRREIIHQNRFLWQIYDQWYRRMAAAVPSGEGSVVELGSGAGFLDDYLPACISTDIFPVANLGLVCDGQAMPFASGSLRALLMVDVFHHVPDSRALLQEAARCLRPGGVMVMNEPWVTPWSRLIYQNLHHEPFIDDATRWGFDTTGPLSGANIALPWIVFERDRDQFEAEYPQWRVRRIQPHTPFRYLVSGGVSMRQLMPGWTFPLWTGLEHLLSPARHWLGMFALIELERRAG
ncbi:MAG: class I SAM-dependent methyltransferase [Chloroflexi bacterium]|nr:class I SAM-dependent methyltransferase [Chloroflexota bacterium]